MKKLFIVLLLLTFTIPCLAQDRIMTQVQFRKAWWTCPKCLQEDFTDLNVGTPSVYTHKCSKCGFTTNSFKEYQGSLSYLKTTYDTIDPSVITTAKQERIDKWVYDVKNPPPYIPPTLEDLQRMLSDKQLECEELQRQIDEITPISD